VLDRVSFSRHRGSGFDAAVFEPAFDESSVIWRNEEAIAEAQVLSWYKTFYEETDAGRLTTFRDDIGTFHYVPDWKVRAHTNNTVQQLATRLSRIEHLLWGVLLGLELLMVLK
jgi:hypothetical protein